MLLPSPFYRRGNWGSERLSSLPKVTQVVSRVREARNCVTPISPWWLAECRASPSTCLPCNRKSKSQSCCCPHPLGGAKHRGQVLLAYCPKSLRGPRGGGTSRGVAPGKEVPTSQRPCPAGGREKGSEDGSQIVSPSKLPLSEPTMGWQPSE